MNESHMDKIRFDDTAKAASFLHAARTEGVKTQGEAKALYGREVDKYRTNKFRSKYPVPVLPARPRKTYADALKDGVSQVTLMCSLYGFRVPLREYEPVKENAG